jgi:hypothetical protein
MWEELWGNGRGILTNAHIKCRQKVRPSLPTMAVFVLEFRLLDFGEVGLYGAEFKCAHYHITQFLSVHFTFALFFASQKYQVNEGRRLTL